MRIILHVDLDAFFPSVEVRERGSDKMVPLIKGYGRFLRSIGNGEDADFKLNHPIIFRKIRHQREGNFHGWSCNTFDRQIFPRSS
jgi:hypothetical protein